MNPPSQVQNPQQTPNYMRPRQCSRDLNRPIFIYQSRQVLPAPRANHNFQRERQQNDFVPNDLNLPRGQPDVADIPQPNPLNQFPQLPIALVQDQNVVNPGLAEEQVQPAEMARRNRRASHIGEEDPENNHNFDRPEVVAERERKPDILAQGQLQLPQQIIEEKLFEALPFQIEQVRINQPPKSPYSFFPEKEIEIGEETDLNKIHIKGFCLRANTMDPINAIGHTKELAILFGRNFIQKAKLSFDPRDSPIIISRFCINDDQQNGFFEWVFKAKKKIHFSEKFLKAFANFKLDFPESRFRLLSLKTRKFRDFRAKCHANGGFFENGQHESMMLLSWIKNN